MLARRFAFDYNVSVHLLMKDLKFNWKTEFQDQPYSLLRCDYLSFSRSHSLDQMTDQLKWCHGGLPNSLLVIKPSYCKLAGIDLMHRILLFFSAFLVLVRLPFPHSFVHLVCSLHILFLLLFACCWSICPSCNRVLSETWGQASLDVFVNVTADSLINVLFSFLGGSILSFGRRLNAICQQKIVLSLYSSHNKRPWSSFVDNGSSWGTIVGYSTVDFHPSYIPGKKWEFCIRADSPIHFHHVQNSEPSSNAAHELLGLVCSSSEFCLEIQAREALLLVSLTKEEAAVAKAQTRGPEKWAA